MKFKTPYFILEFEILFVLTILVTILSSSFRNYFYSYYLCYLFILFHELSHMFIAAILGKEISNFKFSLSGVNISFKEDYLNKNNISKVKDILIYLAGPLSNMLLALIFRKSTIIFNINIFLAILNLLPIYPLDGYNILENIISVFFYIKKCNIIMELISNIFFIILLMLGIVQLIMFNSPSILVFLLYVYILNQNSKKTRKIKQIIRRSIY